MFFARGSTMLFCFSFAHVDTLSSAAPLTLILLKQWKTEDNIDGSCDRYKQSGLVGKKDVGLQQRIETKYR